MSPHPVIEAEHEFACQTLLGEGILWDPATQLVHWLDIDQPSIHSYDPATKAYTVDVYPEETKLTSMSPLSDGSGFVASMRNELKIVPAPTRLRATSPTKSTQTRTALRSFGPTFSADTHPPVRWNDGTADPRGRFLVGSMAFEVEGVPPAGELWRFEADGSSERLLQDVGCSNGLGWSPDHKILYYVDSHKKILEAFDYDLATGSLSGRRTVAPPPPGLDGADAKGVYDGLCMDGVGNIWVARWGDSRVVGFRPDGTIICSIVTPGARSVTIPCFGGKDLETMYVMTAHATLASAKQEDFPKSGDLFKVDFSEGSEVRKLLGADWKGATRFTYGGKA